VKARSVIIALIGTVLSVLATGCRNMPTCCHCAYGVPGPIDLERQSIRDEMVVDASGVAPYSELRTLPGVPASAEYRRLTAVDCQCLAAENSPMAVLLLMENQFVGRQGHQNRKSSMRAANIHRRVLNLRSIDERNRTSGEALKTFYQLAEAEGKRDLVGRSIIEINKTIDNVSKIKDKGLEIDVDKGELERQRIDLVAKSVTVDMTIQQLNGKLRFLLHLDAVDTTPIWPDVDLTPNTFPIEMESAIIEGLTSRPDLAALRLTRDTLDEDTLPLARKSLRQIDMMFGMESQLPASLRRLIGRDDTTNEIRARRQQLSQVIYDRERAVVEEIRSAVLEIDAGVREIALAVEKINSLRSRREDLQKMRGANLVTPFDISSVNLDILHAESALLENVIKWKTALAKLRQTQGILPLECGFGLPGECCVTSSS